MLKKYIYNIIILLLVALITLPTFSFATDSVFVWSTNDASNNMAIETNSNVSSDDSMEFESESCILIEQSTGTVLYEKNSHEQLRPASVTKIMSILLIMEALDNGTISLNYEIPCSENAASMGGSQIWLDTTETLTVHEMLKAICVVSANDCTVAMAEYLAGSEEAFVEKMNLRARELGMNDTVFKNCHGIDEDGHVTSAYDISLMSRELLLNHPKITEYTTIWMDSLRDGKSELVNTNKLIRNYQGATGLKTGSTSLALYNLSASATRNDLSLIAVIMKAPSTKVRFSEAQKLLDFGFANYSFKTFGSEGEAIKTVNVEKGVTSTVNAIFETSASVLFKKGDEKNIVQNINISDTVTAPVHKGQRLGEVNFTLNGETIQTINIVAENDVNKINLWNMTTYLYKTWFNMCRT